MARSLLLALLVSLPAAALDPFEIQVYDGTANEPGRIGLEMHVNYVANGLRSAPAPELAPNHNAHFTIEPSYGVTSFWELGAYVQGTFLPGGTFDYSGLKLRSKFVTPPEWSERLRFGINLELSRLPAAYDRARWGAEIRPIAAWEDERWLFAVNPNIGLALAGPDASEGPELEPCAMAKIKLGVVALGVEYYGSMGPLRSLLPLSQQEHYVFETVDVLAWKGLELNVGIGQGLTSASNGLVVKTIVGFSFGH